MFTVHNVTILELAIGSEHLAQGLQTQLVYVRDVPAHHNHCPMLSFPAECPVVRKVLNFASIFTQIFGA